MIAVVTGAAGLVGSATIRRFHAGGYDVVGIDNHLREHFFGPDGANKATRQWLEEHLPRYRHLAIDVRDRTAVEALFGEIGGAVTVVVHAAAQPSHEWSLGDPVADFEINAGGTVNLLEATRRHAPAATFVYTSSSKVYGDHVNRLPRVEHETRIEIDPSHPFAEHGVDESMSIDASCHGPFGASKAAADLAVQEYGRSFGLRTGIFRSGCITGGAHAGAELHGFLAYLARCVVQGRSYTVFGYGGKQVRDNIHADDLADAMWHFCAEPRPGGLYNMGGSRHSHVSVLEAIAKLEKRAGCRLDYSIDPEHRVGDHVWWISDVRHFQRDYPGWKHAWDLDAILDDLTRAARSS